MTNENTAISVFKKKKIKKEKEKKKERTELIKRDLL